MEINTPNGISMIESEKEYLRDKLSSEDFEKVEEKYVRLIAMIAQNLYQECLTYCIQELLNPKMEKYDFSVNETEIEMRKIEETFKILLTAVITQNKLTINKIPISKIFDTNESMQ